jgi:hypothetical protein
MMWTKFFAISATAAILVGAVVLRSSFLNAASKNWTPVHLPVPPPSASVSAPFELTSNGEFELQVVTSATRTERSVLNREGSPIEMFIAYHISGPKGFQVTRSITQMQLSSWTSDTDIYTASGMVTLPSGGDYDVVFQVGRRAALFADRGGVIQFERVAPSGYGLLYPVLNGFSYLCFLFACATLAVISKKSATHA